MRLPRRLALALAPALLATGCATNLATVQTPRTLEPLHVRAYGGGGAYLPVGQLAEAKKLADQHAAELKAAQNGNAQLPDQKTQAEILRLAASLAVLPPEPVAEIGGRLGLVKHLDAGFTWSTSAWRVDAKWQLTGDKGNFALALMGGVEVYTFDVSLYQLESHLKQASQLFQYAHFQNPQRYDGEITLLGGWRFFGGVLDIYLAGKYRLGWYRLPAVLHVDTPNGTLDAKATLAGLVHYGGGAFGFGIGPSFVKLFVEVNVGYATSTSSIFGSPEQLGGLAVYPAAALAFKF